MLAIRWHARFPSFLRFFSPRYGAGQEAALELHEGQLEVRQLRHDFGSFLHDAPPTPAPCGVLYLVPTLIGCGWCLQSDVIFAQFASSGAGQARVLQGQRDEPQARPGRAAQEERRAARRVVGVQPLGEVIGVSCSVLHPLYIG